ncbi:MAG: hypothetical protein AB7E47_02365 [Desulfovibrionaceae bacterium]
MSAASKLKAAREAQDAERRLHRCMVRVFETPDGKRVLGWLRMQCFMLPGQHGMPVTGAAPPEAQLSRMRLFQLMQFYMDASNFPSTAQTEE